MNVWNAQITSRILVLGGTGQVGLELAACTWPDEVELDAPSRDVAELSNAAAIEGLVAKGGYSAVINCAAWTAVDAAEDDIAGTWLANAQGPANLAAATARANIPLVQVSTDYVFPGDLDRPYREDDPTGPQGVYGASKLAGEWAVLTGNRRSVVLRTAWVLSRYRANFAKTMLRLAGDRDTISVVADQLGCPTSARDIAAALQAIVLRLIESKDAPTGIYHFVNTGEATWSQLARYILDKSAELGGPSARVNDITTADFPTRANRPANSRLSTERLTAHFGITPRSWQESVAEVVADLVSEKLQGAKAA